jgi:hypothetical protein
MNVYDNLDSLAFDFPKYQFKQKIKNRITFNTCQESSNWPNNEKYHKPIYDREI